MISPELMRRLMYAKYIYCNGCDLLNQNLYLSGGMAILNFQDSIEILLRVIAEYVNANIKDSSSFNHIINEINNMKISKSKIPQKSFLNQLNKSRVNFKHYGNLPITQDVQKFKIDLDIFFRYVVKIYLDIEYDQISLVSVITNRRVQNYLRKAESDLENDKFEDCIVNSTIAFKLIFQTVREYKHYGYEKIPSFHTLDNIIANEILDFIQDIYDRIDMQKEQINILTYGINLSEFFKFKMVTPNIQFNMLGNIIGINKTLYSPINLYTYENAQFCLRFAIDTALCVQKNRVIGFLFNEDKLPKYQVVKKSKVIVTPHSKIIEEICEVNEGENFLGYYENYNTKDYVGILLDDNVAYIKSDDVKEI